MLPPPCASLTEPCTSGGLPSEFGYRNLGEVINKGIELGIDGAVNAALNVFEVPAKEIIGDRRSQGARGAIDHYALAVDSLATLESTRDRIVAAGAEIGEIQRLGSEWSLFFRDPDGMELEVCCKADD